MPPKKATNLPTLPAQADIEKQLAPLVADLPAIVINTDEDYVTAGAELRNVKGQQKRVDAMRKEALAPIAELRTTVDGWFKPTLQRLELHENGLKAAIRGYDERREAERRRIEAELRDQHAREIAAAVQEANELSQQGKDEEAEAVLDLLPMPPTVVSAKPKLDGIGIRQLWRGTVINFEEFLVWCIDHDRLDLLEVNDQALQAFARTTRGTVHIDGARVYSETSLAARAS